MPHTICVLAKKSPSQPSSAHFTIDAYSLIQLTVFFGASEVCFGAGVAAFGAGVALFGAGAFFVSTPAPLHSVERIFPAQVPYL